MASDFLHRTSHLASFKPYPKSSSAPKVASYETHQIFCTWECRALARKGRSDRCNECPHSGIKQTSIPERSKPYWSHLAIMVRWSRFLPCSLSPAACFFLKFVFFVVLTSFGELDPIERCADGPRRIHARHSGALICTRLVKLLRPGCGRSVIMIWPSRRASCIVFCTRVRQTPASAAILSIGRSHMPWCLISPATIHRTARWPSV